MTTPITSRRRFLKSGMGIAVSVASVAALSKTVAQTTAQEHTHGAINQQSNNQETEWVAAGYLMAAPMGFKPKC